MYDDSSKHPASFRSIISHPLLRELYDLWLARRGASGAMLRKDLDPTEVPHLLKSLILTDVGKGGHDIRYRLVGTEIVAAHGIDYTGKTIEELTSGSTLEFTRQLYGTVVQQVVAVFSQGHFRWAGKEHCWTKRLHLPLSRTGEVVDMVLVGQVYESKAPGNHEELRPALPEELEADRISARRGV